MTQPPDSSQQPGEEQDPNKTTVFRPGDAGFGAPPPFGGAEPPPAPPPPAAPPQPDYGGQPAYGAPPPPPPPPAQPYGGQPAYGAPQQGYGQPAYQPPAYGQPGYAPQVSPYNQGAAPQRAFGVVGAVLAAIGAVACILAFTALNWFGNVSGDVLGAKNAKFSDVHDVLNKLDSELNQAPEIKKLVHFGISKEYFSWLAWALLAAAVVVTVLALLPSKAAPALRAVSLIVGLAGAGVTLWAIDLFSVDKGFPSGGGKPPSYTEFIKHTSIGAWLAVAGFVLLGIAGAVGPRQRSRG